METIKIKTRTYLDAEFEVPKYFKIAHHYFMIINETNYLLVKPEVDNSLVFFPQISCGMIEHRSAQWYEYSISQELKPISEEEFKNEYTKTNVLLLNYLN